MQVFTSVLVLSLVFTFFIISDIKSYNQRKINSMTGLAQVTANNALSTLEFEDDRAANAIVEQLHIVSPEIIAATITDSTGKVFANYSNDQHSSAIPQKIGIHGYKFIGNKLYVSQDIISDNRLMGKVFLEVGLNDLDQIKRTKFRMALLLLFAAIIFSFAIAFIVQAYISNRLLRLVKRMKETRTSGEFKPSLIDEGGDEIGTLVKAFNNLMQTIRENQQKKDEFIGIASHELRTPLTSIKGYVEMLNEMEHEEKHRFFVKKAFENVNKLEKLINDLLDVSKIQGGQLELAMKEFDLGELIDETIASLQTITPNHEIVNQCHLRGTKVLADRQRIEQVLDNLLTNAIKYSPQGKRVIVLSEKTDREVIVKVRDFGLGIPHEEQSDIFERFYRTRNTSITISGFGLGLYICKDIITRHHGNIWVTMEDKGSTFYFSLPLESSQNGKGDNIKQLNLQSVGNSSV
jgi:signal transduction histidine kinase